MKTVSGKTRFHSYLLDFVIAKFRNTWLDKSDDADQGKDLSFLITPEQQYHKIVRDWMKANGN